MSEQQPPVWPPAPEPDRTRPSQGWAPARLPGAERASFATHDPAETSPTGPKHSGRAIDRYAPRRSLIPAIIALASVIAAAAIVYTTTRPQSLPAASPSPSHSASPSAGKRPGKPFTADRSRATGVWQITNSRWTSQGLDVFIEVTLDTGALTPSFDAMPNSGSGYVDSEPSTQVPGFALQAIQPASTARGWLFFPTSRETTLIFLGDANDPQISGIEVPA